MKHMPENKNIHSYRSEIDPKITSADFDLLKRLYRLEKLMLISCREIYSYYVDGAPYNKHEIPFPPTITDKGYAVLRENSGN